MELTVTVSSLDRYVPAIIIIIEKREGSQALSASETPRAVKDEETHRASGPFPKRAFKERTIRSWC